MKSLINNILFTCLGFSIILYYLYLRLIMTKLPRFLTSSGRILTHSYFLNLQNFKLTKAFVIMHKVADITSDNYKRIKLAFKQAIQTPSLQKVQEDKKMLQESTCCIKEK